jgi:hypothetical protein
MSPRDTLLAAAILVVIGLDVWFAYFRPVSKEELPGVYELEYKTPRIPVETSC